MVETTDLHFLHIDDGGDMMLRLKILRTSDRSKPSSIGWAFKMCLVLFPKPGKHFYEMTEDGENRHPHETYPKPKSLKRQKTGGGSSQPKKSDVAKEELVFLFHIHIYAGKAHSSFYKCP